jgi:hypothetical protein
LIRPDSGTCWPEGRADGTEDANVHHAMTFFATRPMLLALNERIKTMGWTLGGVIEDLLVKASGALQGMSEKTSLRR